MRATAQLCKGTPVTAGELQKKKIYTVATTDEGIMSLEYVGPHVTGVWLVFKKVNDNGHPKYVHPSSLFFDPAGPPQEDVTFDPDDPDDEYGEGTEEDGSDDATD